MKATNETRKPTATNGKGCGAGASATSNANNGAANSAKAPTKRVWRTTTRQGERVLIDPDGHVYHGTAQEIREAALMPYRRDELADDIKTARYIAAKFSYTPEARREYVREKRRDAIHSGNYDANFGESVHVPADVYILLKAGARLVLGEGKTVDDFFRGLFESEVDALLDVAQNETGKREIPLTRYERAALDRLRAHG